MIFGGKNGTCKKKCMKKTDPCYILSFGIIIPLQLSIKIH